MRRAGAGDQGGGGGGEVQGGEEGSGEGEVLHFVVF